MPNPDATPPRARLDRALENLALTFRGMTARADEVQCTCHWGGEDELTRLKMPDVELVRRDPGDDGKLLRTVRTEMLTQFDGDSYSQT
ncbi:hypothetical protein [Streptomyces sp. NPDC048242]|uniref:hypothetical protein n=1 Tax=Streptomyces sp. NPDC048242 TaxID=3155026 RepID=UPI00344A7877